MLARDSAKRAATCLGEKLVAWLSTGLKIMMFWTALLGDRYARRALRLRLISASVCPSPADLLARSLRNPP